MPMKKVIPHLLFMLVFAVQLYSIHSYADELRMLSKVLICPVLIGFLWLENRFSTSFYKHIAIGLFFGWLGDIFLLFPDYFLFGLGAFLIGHGFYLFAFLEQFKKADMRRDRFLYLITMVLGIYSLYLYQILAPSLGVEKYPVICYIFLIALMAVFAYGRRHRTSMASFIAIFLGALLFVISDSILAITKFVAYVPNSGLMIMLTYMLAQYGISLGAVWHKSYQDKLSSSDNHN